MQATEIQPKEAVKFIRSIIDSISDVEMYNFLEEKTSLYFDTILGQSLYGVLSGISNAMTERNPVKGESDLKKLFHECRTKNLDKFVEVSTDEGIVSVSNASLSYVCTIRLLLAIYCPNEHNPIFRDFFDRLDLNVTIRENLLDEDVAECLKDKITELYRDSKFILPEQYLKAQKDSKPTIGDFSEEALVDLTLISGPRLKDVGIDSQDRKQKRRITSQNDTTKVEEREPKKDRKIITLDKAVKKELKIKLGQILKIFQDYDSVDIFSNREALLNLTLKINGLFESLERMQAPTLVIEKLRKDLNSYSVSKVWDYCSRNTEETINLPFGLRTSMTSIKKNLEAILKFTPNWLK